MSAKSMSKQERTMKRRKPSLPHFCFSLSVFALALLLSVCVGVLIAQWQPSFFGAVAPWQVRSGEKERFVLVASRLFNTQESTLRPESLPLLNALSNQLPTTKHTIRVVSYMHPQVPNDVLNLSYQRAVNTKEYLQQRSGADRYYWFAVGINGTEPQGIDRIEVIISRPN